MSLIRIAVLDGAPLQGMDLSGIFAKQRERNAQLPVGELERRHREAEPSKARERVRAEYRQRAPGGTLSRAQTAQLHGGRMAGGWCLQFTAAPRAPPLKASPLLC
jgi:hypothetical protein